MDGEKWLPIQHDRKVRVRLDAPSHRVTTKDGKTYGIAMVSVIHRIEHNGPDDPTWTLQRVILVPPRGRAFLYHELKHPPAWLEDILARAEPIDP